MSNHAYLIMADNDFESLKYLLPLIDDERNDIYVHIDKKITKENFSFLYHYVCRSKLYFIARSPINWGGISMMRCEFNLFKSAYKKGEYEYFHLLSAKDLPLHSQDYIHNFIDNLNKGKEFVEVVPEEKYPSNHIKERLYFFHILPEISFKSFSNILLSKSWSAYRKVENRIQKLLRINIFTKYGLKFGYGSQWVSVDREFVEYMLENEKTVYDIFKNSEIPDESFIQTLIVNSPYFSSKLYFGFDSKQSENLRFIDWNLGRPYTWKKENVNMLVDAQKKGYLFSRKFDFNLDLVPIKIIQDKIKEESAEKI